jgi:hypothetical protein
MSALLLLLLLLLFYKKILIPASEGCSEAQKGYKGLHTVINIHKSI